MNIKSVKRNQSRNPWINFYSNYSPQHKEHTIPTNKKKTARGSVMRDAAQRWKLMSDADKAAYKYAAPSAPFKSKYKSIWTNVNTLLDGLRDAHKSGREMIFVNGKMKLSRN